MGGARRIAVMLLAAACAAALAACGGGGSSSTSTSTGSTESKPAQNGGNSGGGAKEPRQSGGKTGGNSSQENGGSGGGSGGASERSSSFRTPGGDNSIQEYGSEASAEERASATKTISGFYAAMATEDWAKVCGLLSAKNLAALKLFSEKVQKAKGKGCTGILALVTPKTSSKPPETIKGEVISLRRHGDVSFALYHGVDGKNYAYPLKLEEGSWKLTALAPTPLSF
ncbi:MAG: hypothetical protein ACHQCF_03210 [Solirubrobacterales bacterium]